MNSIFPLCTTYTEILYLLHRKLNTISRISYSLTSSSNMTTLCPCQIRLADSFSSATNAYSTTHFQNSISYKIGLENKAFNLHRRDTTPSKPNFRHLTSRVFTSNAFFHPSYLKTKFNSNTFNIRSPYPLSTPFNSNSITQSSNSPVDELVSTPTMDESTLQSQLNSETAQSQKSSSGFETKLTDKSSVFENSSSDLTFSSLGLSPRVIQRLNQIGVANPTDIQSEAIPAIFKGDDIALQSYTGSGKTLSFLLPILSSVGPLRRREVNATASSASDGPNNRSGNFEKKDYRGIEAVIVAPSRELAMQIFREAERILGVENKNAVHQLIGGANQRRQEESLKSKKPMIVIGTPGRISDLSRAGKLQTHFCRFLVLDEADSLLSHKFRLDMMRILDHVGRRRSSDSPNEAQNAQTYQHRKERQTILVSATMPSTVLEAASNWGNRPVHVKVNPVRKVNSIDEMNGAVKVRPTSVVSSNLVSGSPTAANLQGIKDSIPPNLEHRFIISPQRHRVDVLRKCIHALDAKSVIVFMNFGKRLKDTEFKLGARQMSVANLHGGIDKVKRASVLSAFRDGKVRVLVVSEVAARGLDIMSCDLVINLELPSDALHYAHRAGRTGRLGQKGVVITICEESESFVITKFSKLLEIDISRAEVYEGKLMPYAGKMKY